MDEIVFLLQTASPNFFEGFDPQQRFVLAIVAIGCTTLALIVGISIIGGVWFHIRKNQEEFELKRDLLDQGKSADEIEKIIRPADPFSRAIGGWCRGDKDS